MIKPTIQITLDGIPIAQPQPMFVLLTEAPKGPSIGRGMELMYFRREQEKLKKLTSIYQYTGQRD